MEGNHDRRGRSSAVVKVSLGWGKEIKIVKSVGLALRHSSARGMRLHGGQCGAILQWLPSELVVFNSQNLPVLSSVPASGSGGRFSRLCFSALVRERAEGIVNALKRSLVLRRDGFPSPVPQSYPPASKQMSVGLSETLFSSGVHERS